MIKIGIIGLGNMGTAIAQILKDNYKLVECRKGDDLGRKLQNAAIIILAVKPQNFSSVCESLKIDLSGKIIISVMAGVEINHIKKSLNVGKVVRCMPNLPLKIRQAVIPWISENLSPEEKVRVKNIFRKFGEEFEMKNEEDIGITTVVVGSGPAYFARLVECLMKFLIRNGVDEEKSRKIAVKTFIGSAALLKKEKLTPEILRQKVTSKGGCTEVVMKVLDDNKISEIFLNALEVGLDKTHKLNECD